jgi:hypothetical protein
MDDFAMSRHYLRMVSSRARNIGPWRLLLALAVVTGAGCAQLLGLEELGKGVDGGTPPDAAEKPPDAAIVECAEPTDCIDAVPICDLGLGMCRGCALDEECRDRDPQAPICAPNGRCGACASDPNCTDPERPICDQDTLTCRGCEAHDECASAVCDIGASVCVDPAEIVYISATGSFDTGCGAQNLPCRSIRDGVAQATFDRSYLRLTGTFDERMTLSANRFRVIGEGATLDLTPVDFDDMVAGITVNMGAQVLIDGLRVTNLSVGGGIECSQGELTLRRVTVDSNEGTGVVASDCPLIIDESRITGNSVRGVEAYAATGGSLVIERSLIAENYRGGINAGVTPLLIRNNLILRNSNLSEYNGAIRLNGNGTNAFITYNTIVGNMVNENFIGIIACGSAVLSSNIIWGNMYPPSTEDQTLFGCDEVRNNVSDSLLGGVPQNHLGDPEFVSVDDDDYQLLPGSLGIDLGEPELANLLDYAGNPRPVGAGPDIGALEAPAP